MSEENAKDRLGQVIDRLWKEFGFTSRSAFWDAAGITNKTYWNKRADGNVPTAKKHLDQLIEGLAEAGYRLTAEQKQALYEAGGMKVIIEPENPPLNPPPAPAATNPNSGPDNQVKIESQTAGRDINQGNTYNYYAEPQQWNCPRLSAAPLVFGGRDTELAALKERLKANQLIALTSLNGLGGIGKTTLARQLAYDLSREAEEERVFRAVLWVEFNRKPLETTILEELGRQADPAFRSAPGESLDQLTGRVKTTLQKAIAQGCAPCQQERVLLVVDDVWETGLKLAGQLLDEVKGVRPANCSVLITTRSQKVATDLNIGQGQRFMLNRLSPPEGADMLREYLSDLSLLELDMLSRVLDGYTLALKLAAQRLLDRSNPRQQIALHLKQYREALPAGANFADLEMERGEDKEKNLTKALYYSYELLTEVQQAAFRQLGVMEYGQPFDLTLAAGLWGLAEDKTQAVIDRLWQLALLEVLPPEDPATIYLYRLHPVLQAYARALLSEDKTEQAATQTRYQEVVISVAEQFRKLPPEEWGQLSPYLPHIHAVGAALVQQYRQAQPEPDESLTRRALAFALNTRHYLFRRREVRESVWLEMGLEASLRLQDRRRESLFRSELGLFYSALGEKGRALQYYEQALPLVKAVGDRGGEARTLNNIGAVYNDLGEKGRALEYYEQALPLRRAVGDKDGEAYTLNNLGILLWELGEAERGLALVEQARDLFEYVRSPNAQVSARIVEQMRAAMAGNSPSAPATLPPGQIEVLVSNTVAVMTNAPEQLEMWRELLQGFRHNAAKQGAGWESDIAFLDALLEVTNGRAEDLPETNPYRPHLQRVLAAIARQ